MAGPKGPAYKTNGNASSVGGSFRARPRALNLYYPSGLLIDRQKISPYDIFGSGVDEKVRSNLTE